MKCVICHSPDIQVADVKEEISIGGDIVQVSIRVPVCRSCGEWYYDRKTMHYLEQVKAELAGKTEELRQVGRVLEFA